MVDVVVWVQEEVQERRDSNGRCGCMRDGSAWLGMRHNGECLAVCIIV